MSLQKDMALQIQDCVDKTGFGAVAVVCEASGMHVTDGSVSVLLSAPDDPDVAEKTLSATDLGAEGLASLDVADLRNAVPLNYDGEPEGLQDLIAARERVIYGERSSDDVQGGGSRLTHNECNVYPISQPQGSQLCWAASMSMLYGFHRGTYYSAAYVAIYYHDLFPDPVYHDNPIPGRPYYDYMRSGDWVAERLSTYLCLGNYQHRMWERLPYQTIQAYIDYQYPIIGGWNGYTAPNTQAPGGWHMNVIKGYYNYNIYLNDPKHGEDLAALPYASNGTYYWAYGIYSTDLACLVYMVQVADIRAIPN